MDFFCKCWQSYRSGMLNLCLTLSPVMVMYFNLYKLCICKDACYCMWNKILQIMWWLPFKLQFTFTLTELNMISCLAGCYQTYHLVTRPIIWLQSTRSISSFDMIRENRSIYFRYSSFFFLEYWVELLMCWLMGSVHTWIFSFLPFSPSYDALMKIEMK